jgi:integrase
MNVKFFIIKGKRKFSTIHVRFWDSKRYDSKVSTGIYVQPENWSSAKQRIKPTAYHENVDFLNDKLTKLESYIFNRYNRDYNNSKLIHKSWLKETVEKFSNRLNENDSHKIFLVDWAEKYIERSKNRTINGKSIGESALKNYKTTLNKLKSYEEYSKTKIDFKSIDLDFHGSFINYCQDIENLSPSTIGNLIKRIKTFCRAIDIEGHEINKAYKLREFYAPSNETFDTYLNEEEIQLIFDHDFSDSDKLSNARDLFIIGLRTGLRISDFLRISKENIINNVINITTKKTGQNLTIPIHPQFEKILSKSGGQLPRKISDQKFNKYIKEICEEAGINSLTPGMIRNDKNRKEFGVYPKFKLISSHTCRRSFATNLYLAGIETKIIMRATGHKSEKQLLQYIKASQDEHVKMISNYWKKHEIKI